MNCEGKNPLFFLRENCMISEEKVRALVEEKIAETSFFIVDLKENKVEIFNK